MDQQSSPTNEVMIDALVSKVNQHEVKIVSQESKIIILQEVVEKAPDLNIKFDGIKTSINELSANIKNQQFPKEPVENLYKRLGAALALFKSPIETRTHHHHHFHLIAWLTAGLFVSICLVGSGWYMSVQSLKVYEANDTKYRRLKLIAPLSVSEFLWQLDSEYLRDPDNMRANVIEQEQLRQQRQDLAEKIKMINNQITDSATEPQPEKKHPLKGNH